MFVLCCVVLCCVVLCCVVLCVVCVAWVLVSRYQSGVSCVGVGFKVWFDRPFLDRPSPGPPFPWTAQNFALFFSLSRRKIGRGPQMCTFGLSGCRLKPRRRPGASNTTKIPREDPQRGKKRTNFAAGQGKKERNFGPPTLWAPTLRTPTLRPPTLRGPHPPKLDWPKSVSTVRHSTWSHEK